LILIIIILFVIILLGIGLINFYHSYASYRSYSGLYISTEHEQTIYLILPRDRYSVIACHKDKIAQSSDDEVRHLSETPWCVISDGEKAYEVYTRRFEFELNAKKTVTLRIIPNDYMENSGYKWFELSVYNASHRPALPFQMEKMKIAN